MYVARQSLLLVPEVISWLRRDVSIGFRSWPQADTSSAKTVHEMSLTPTFKPRVDILVDLLISRAQNFSRAQSASRRFLFMFSAANAGGREGAKRIWEAKNFEEAYIYRKWAVVHRIPCGQTQNKFVTTKTLLKCSCFVKKYLKSGMKLFFIVFCYEQMLGRIVTCFVEWAGCVLASLSPIGILHFNHTINRL